MTVAMHTIFAVLLFSAPISCGDFLMDEAYVHTIDDAPPFLSTLLASVLEGDRSSVAISSEVDWILEMIAWNTTGTLFDRLQKNYFSGESNKRPHRLKRIKQPQPLDFKELYTAIFSIVSEIKTGWVVGTSKDAERTFFRRDFDDWHLFIKRSYIVGEDILLTNLARLLRIKDDVICDDNFLGMNEDGNQKYIYLWLRHDQYEEIMNALQLRITRPTLMLSRPAYNHDEPVAKKLSDVFLLPSKTWLQKNVKPYFSFYYSSPVADSPHRRDTH